jgi:hypothetical protein
MLSFIRRFFQPNCIISCDSDIDDRNVSNFVTLFYQDIASKFVVQYEWLVAINAYFLVSGLFALCISIQPFIHFEQVMIPNLPFCETPFAITPYMAQGASAMAHLPYVPVLLLAIGSCSPETIPTLDERTNPQAVKIKHFLWVQTGLQTISSIGGHMLPNPRIVMNQEISIAIAFLLLYSFFDLTTSKSSRWIVDFKAFTLFACVSIVGYLWFGLMPVIFTLFATSIAINQTIQGAFGLLTPLSSSILLSIFIPTTAVLALETVACEWLLANVSYILPWHLLFDILFWQVLGSAIDVIFISPVPGRFMMDDTME